MGDAAAAVQTSAPAAGDPIQMDTPKAFSVWMKLFIWMRNMGSRYKHGASTYQQLESDPADGTMIRRRKWRVHVCGAAPRAGDCVVAAAGARWLFHTQQERFVRSRAASFTQRCTVMIVCWIVRPLDRAACGRVSLLWAEVVS